MFLRWQVLKLPSNKTDFRTWDPCNHSANFLRMHDRCLPFNADFILGI